MIVGFGSWVSVPYIGRDARLTRWFARNRDFFSSIWEFDVNGGPAAIESGMREALALAARGRGCVEPNPLVCAVELDPGGQKAGEGWHQRFGEAHAEINALADAGERARGGTLFVSLEPCRHWGKTPPCTDAVLRSGVKRVVVAMADPFPRVDGGGIAILQDAGLEVQIGCCATEARRLNAAYLKLVRTGRPWVHVKWAMSLDGKIATGAGDSKWISGEESRRRVHELRGRMDAIIVGRGTVAADDPLLTARPPGPRKATRIVLTASGELPEERRLRSTAREVPVLLFTAAGNEVKLAGWAAEGCELISLPRCENGSFIDAVLAELGGRRMTNILVEGGAKLLGAFLDARAADEFHVFIAPKILGGNRALSPVGGRGIVRVAEALALAEPAVSLSGEDVYVHGVAGIEERPI
jgi:diaminohydroxyphosphoribosylaminopyrimidine deaminase/5-amino-6-(5-phosphoribosylamino)uracil reductase